MFSRAKKIMDLCKSAEFTKSNKNYTSEEQKNDQTNLIEGHSILNVDNEEVIQEVQFSQQEIQEKQLSPVHELPITKEIDSEPSTSVFPDEYDPANSDVDNSNDDPTYTDSDKSSTSSHDIKRRKRKCPEKWKQNVRKLKRNGGEEYLSVKACANCIYKCTEKLNEEARLKICSEFWNMKDLYRQRDYIISRVQRHETLDSRLVESRRKYTNYYTLSYLNNTFRIGKRFFLSTLDILEKMMRTAIQKKDRSQSGVPSPDKRGRHPPAIKLPEDTMKYIDEHISSFSTVPSHWCRKYTKKIYLESILNKEKMYSLYVGFCKEKSIKPASKTTYKEALIRKNIGFYTPRKDQCWCYEFEHTTGDEENFQKEEEYNLHIRRKEAANNNKKEDALKAKNDNSFVTCNFDLEAVLYCPLYFVKPIFYKRKLAVYNFTIYEVAKKKGFCFLWDETQGNRGANEIGTCIAKYIHDLPKNVTHLTMFCDNCPGQNRNSIIVAMMRNSLLKHESLETIEIKFLEVGHTHMECDSMHSTIETASKHAKVFLPSDWYNIITLAKQKGTPYLVHQFTYNDFKDYKKYKDVTMPNCNVATDGNILNWKMVRWVKFSKSNLNILYYKNEYWDDNFKQLDVQYKKRGRKTKIETQNSIELENLYPATLKVSSAKYKDLINLCSTEVIPKIYHNFYKNLPHVTSNSTSSEDDEIETQVMREKIKRRI